MIKLRDGRYLIGFDDGYQLSKTANFHFENGVHELGEIETSLSDNTLFYEKNYYKVGEGRDLITDDKLSDEKAKLRTMAGIALELRAENIYKAKIILAVGLPFLSFGRDRRALADYYMKKNFSFSYEGEEYDICIDGVRVFPQCYSAVASRLGNMQEDYIVVDIGGKTTDVVYVQNGVPVESKSVTIEKAMVKWIKEIQHGMKLQTGKEISEKDIMNVICQETSHIPNVFKELIHGMLREKMQSLELDLKERNYDLDYTNVIYVGGGALVAREYAGKYSRLAAYDPDICANAKGYEFLANQIERRRATQ